MTPLLFALALAAAPDGIPFERTYDRFGSMTRVIVGHDLAPRTTFVVTAIHAGESPKPGAPVRYAFKLWRAGRDWRYLKCHTFRMLADGEPVELPAATHDGEVDDGGVFEFVDVGWVSVQALVQVATAKRVELQVCGDEWVLPPKASTDVERIIALTTPKSDGAWKARATPVEPEPEPEAAPAPAPPAAPDRTAHLPE